MRVVAFSLFLLLSVVCAPAMSQTATLEEKQKAVVVFDIRMDTIRNSDLAKKLKLTEKLSKTKGLSSAVIASTFGYKYYSSEKLQSLSDWKPKSKLREALKTDFAAC